MENQPSFYPKEFITQTGATETEKAITKITVFFEPMTTEEKIDKDIPIKCDVVIINGAATIIPSSDGKYILHIYKENVMMNLL